MFFYAFLGIITQELHKDSSNYIGYALFQAHEGGKSRKAKPLTGLGQGVMEIVSDFDTNTYRAVYVTKIGDKIYVLHCFQKKSTKGISTPKKEVDLIKTRLKEAIQLAERGVNYEKQN